MPVPGPTLHHEALIDGCTDDHVLLGLDGGHDLAHRAGARRADLGEHRVGHARAGTGSVGVVELLVEVGGDLAVGHGEPATMGQPQRVDARGAVERGRDGRPPIDHHRLVVGVLDVSSPDVPGVAGSISGRLARCQFGDPTEEVAGARRAQVVERLGHGDLDVLLGDQVGRRIGIDLREPLDHRVAAGPRERQPSPLAVEVGERAGKIVRGHHRARHAIGPATLRPWSTNPTPQPSADTAATVLADTAPDTTSEVVADELLVEEISIDGMCGVY